MVVLPHSRAHLPVRGPGSHVRDAGGALRGLAGAGLPAVHALHLRLRRRPQRHGLSSRPDPRGVAAPAVVGGPLHGPRRGERPHRPRRAAPGAGPVRARAGHLDQRDPDRRRPEPVGHPVLPAHGVRHGRAQRRRVLRHRPDHGRGAEGAVLGERLPKDRDLRRGGRAHEHLLPPGVEGLGQRRQHGGGKVRADERRLPRVLHRCGGHRACRLEGQRRGPLRVDRCLRPPLAHAHAAAPGPQGVAGAGRAVVPHRGSPGSAMSPAAAAAAAQP
mmetsp:Transcript_17100/g.48664  ORF Transcript_17100/g.48664 Transcript_17100/m.48664 type:complete len:273 (-) Transcript_17100:34-852(-)